MRWSHCDKTPIINYIYLCLMLKRTKLEFWYKPLKTYKNPYFSFPLKFILKCIYLVS